MKLPKQRFSDTGDQLWDLLGGSSGPVRAKSLTSKADYSRGCSARRPASDAVAPTLPGDPVLVVCPACRGCARIVPLSPEATHYFAPRRLVCACGRTREWVGRDVWLGGPIDPYFHLPLWLRANFRGHVLWAYHERHLLLLEQYVSASLREHRRPGTSGGQYRGLLSRLPKWMKSGKNRDGVLRVIARLKGSGGG